MLWVYSIDKDGEDGWQELRTGAYWTSPVDVYMIGVLDLAVGGLLVGPVVAIQWSSKNLTFSTSTFLHPSLRCEYALSN